MATNFCNYQSKMSWIADIVGTAKRESVALMQQILDDTDGSFGGLLGEVQGENGTYQVESVFTDYGAGKQPMVHCDYPAFETDVEFAELSLSEQNQILNLMIAELRRLNA